MYRRTDKCDCYEMSTTKFFLHVFSEPRQHQLHARLGILTTVMSTDCQSHTIQHNMH